MKSKVQAILMATTTALALTAAWGGSCPSDLRHIGGELPIYDNPDLRNYRKIVMETDLARAVTTYRQMGYTTRSAAAAVLEQARAAEGALKSAETCIREVSANPNAVIAELRSGTFRFGGGSISDKCAMYYVAAYYTAIANREAATGLACLANQ